MSGISPAGIPSGLSTRETSGNSDQDQAALSGYTESQTRSQDL